jgi:hypothetical protein
LSIDDHGSLSFRIAYGFFTTVAQFVLPFVTIFVCYTTIILRLRKRPNERKSLVTHSTLKKDFELKVHLHARYSGPKVIKLFLSVNYGFS